VTALARALRALYQRHHTDHGGKDGGVSNEEVALLQGIEKRKKGPARGTIEEKRDRWGKPKLN